MYINRGKDLEYAQLILALVSIRQLLPICVVINIRIMLHVLYLHASDAMDLC